MIEKKLEKKIVNLWMCWWSQWYQTEWCRWV